MRIRTTALATTLLAAGIIGGLTACNDTDTITTKADKKATAAPAKTSEAASEEPTEAPQKDASVGDTITLKGYEDSEQLDVTIVKVVDNAKPADEFFSPEDGHRWLGVQFQLVNTGSAAYNDSPTNGAQVADSDGQQFQPTFADITAGPSMPGSLKLAPGAKGLGWVVFEVPKTSKVTTVQFAMNSGFAEQTGQWKLS